MRIHYQVNDRAECGRGQRMTLHVGNVTCLVCKTRPEFVKAKANADLARQAAFEAQVPRRVAEPWKNGMPLMVCRECDGDLFREGPRTCYGHYANFVCATCGATESRLTETGMSA